MALSVSKTPEGSAVSFLVAGTRGTGDGQQIGAVEPNFNRDLSGFDGHSEAPMSAPPWNDDVIRSSLWLCVVHSPALHHRKAV
jgi:hypothetical protein